MKTIWKTAFLSVAVISVVTGCTPAENSSRVTSEQPISETTKMNAPKQIDSVDEGQKICGGSARIYPEFAPLQQPSYKKTSSATYNYEIDDNIFDFSPFLAKWITGQIQLSMTGFESQVQFGGIVERTSSWKITALTETVANIENSLFTKSSHSPNGVIVKRTYLYNRGTETNFEIQHIFSNKKDAEEKLMQILIDELIILRADVLGVPAQDDALLSDTIDKLPDSIFGSLDVDLVQSENEAKFAGMKLSISESPPWNWFPEGGYDVNISHSKFSSLLKPACKTIFSDPL